MSILEPVTDKIRAVLPSRYPLVGRVFLCDFGQWAYTLHYTSATTAHLTFKTGVVEEVSILVVRLEPHLYLVHWIENDGTVIVHVQNFKEGIVETVTTRMRSTIHRQGTLREVSP